MSDTPYVWVAQIPLLANKQPVDFSAAEKFGQVEPLFDFGDSMLLSEDLTQCVSFAIEEMAEYNPEIDYILPLSLGSPVANMCLTMAAMHISLEQGYDGSVKILTWNRATVPHGRDRSKGFYTPASINMKGITGV